MINFKVIYSSLFVVLFFLNINLTAQEIQVVTPQNALASALEIKGRFGERINVTANNIKAFYYDHWNLAIPYSSNCKHPNADIISMNSESVAFDWPAFPFPSANNHFNIRYLRLTNGTSDLTATNNYAVTLFIPNDLYLVTFQTICSNQASALDIVIIEKPIEPIEDYQGLFDCLDYNLIWTGQPESSHPNMVDYNWENNNPSERYYATAKFIDGPTVSFKANIDFEDAIPKVVAIDHSTMLNTSFNDDKTLLLAHEPNNPEKHLGVFGFFNSIEDDDTPQFSFNACEDASYTLEKVTLRRCNNLLRESETKALVKVDGEASLKSLSNSFDSYKKIEYTLTKEEEISILLFDAHGQIIKTVKSQHLAAAGSYPLDINLAPFPNGIYFCILKTSNKIVPLKLLKSH